MNTKYNVGEIVYIGVPVKNIKADRNGLLYGLDIKGRLYNFSEEELKSAKQMSEDIKCSMCQAE